MRHLRSRGEADLAIRRSSTSGYYYVSSGLFLPSDHPRLLSDYLFLMVDRWSAMVGGKGGGASPFGGDCGGLFVGEVRWGLRRDGLHARQLIAAKI